MSELPISEAVVRRAKAQDAGELLVLQRCCWVGVALGNQTLEVPALHETLEDLEAWLLAWEVYVVQHRHRIVAAVRGRARGTSWEIGRVMVAPDMRGRGLGRFIFEYGEQQAPASCSRFFLYTAPGKAGGIKIYKSCGYEVQEPDISGTGHVDNALFMRKDR